MNTPIAWANYRQCRNNYVHSLNDAKSQYEARQVTKLESQTLSSRSWWQSIKHFLGAKKSDAIPALLLPSGAAVHDNQSKADILNTFFASHSTIDDSSASLPNENVVIEDGLDTVL